MDSTSQPVRLTVDTKMHANADNGSKRIRRGYQPQLISPIDLAHLRRACHSLVLKSEHYNPSEPPKELSPSPSPSPTPSLCGSLAEPASPYTDPTTVDSPMISPARSIPRKSTFPELRTLQSLKENITAEPFILEDHGVATYASPDRSPIPDPVFTTFDFGFNNSRTRVAVVGKPVLVSVSRPRTQVITERPKTASYIERKPVRAEMFPEPPPQPQHPPKTFEEIMGWAAYPTGPGPMVERPLPQVPIKMQPPQRTNTGDTKAQKMKSGSNSGWKGVGKKVGHFSTFMKGWKSKPVA